MMRRLLTPLRWTLWLICHVLIVFGGLVWLALLLSVPAQATTVGLHTFTWHERTQADGTAYNGRNPGAYVMLDNGTTFGAYRNSISRTSAYAGYTVQTPARWFAITAGAITGYDTGPVMPLLVASARIPLGERAALRLLALPRPTPKGSAAISATIEWKLP